MFECWEDMNKHWEIVKFTCGLMHDPNKMVKHVLQEYVKHKISELQLIHQRNRIRRSEMEALAEITRKSKGKSVNLFCNEYFQYVTQQKIPFPSELYYFGPKDYGYIMDRIPNVHGPSKIVTLGAGKCAVIIYQPHLGFWEILNALLNLRQFNQKIQAIYMTGGEEECLNKVDVQLGNSLRPLLTEIESFEVYSELSPATSHFFLEQLQLSCRLETLSTSLTESTDNLCFISVFTDIYVIITKAFGLPKPSLFCNVQRDVASLPSYSKLNSKCNHWNSHMLSHLLLIGSC